jgi:DNA-binding LacI/PurR family transcriptional regulator
MSCILHPSHLQVTCFLICFAEEQFLMEIPSSLPRTPRLHKRRQVADSLRKMVAGLRAGDRLPSVTDLEKHFGVAKSTVEAAVGELQTEGLIVRRQGSGTFVNGPASPVRTHVGRILVSCQPLRPSLNIFAAMGAALEAETRRLGYDPILHFEHSPEQRLAQAQRRWEAREVDGYIHIGSPEEVMFPSAPGVVIGELPEEDARVHQVVVDNYAGGRRVGEYLWGLGHRRAALLAATNLIPAAGRFTGMRDVFRECGADEEDVSYVRVAHLSAPASEESSLEWHLKALLDGPNPPTALFFANDHIALPGLLTLLGWGYRVPQDVSVISFDDTPGLASHTRPALTGMRMPTLALGALAVQTLHEAIQKPGMPFRRLRLPAELIVRESAGPPPPSLRPKGA